MSNSPILNAFLYGIISACSMPLGSITALFWTPVSRMISFLTAFGGGALLAALVIDLVGSATEKGHIFELVIGSIMGSLFYTIVNQLVNNSGGFLRKPSTTLSYLTQQDSRRFQQRLLSLKRIDLFYESPRSFRQQLAQKMLVADYPKGTTIYQQEDPSESLYIIRKGQVKLLDPQADFQPLKHLSDNDVFGQFAFLTGSPHQTVAQTTEDTQLDILPRPHFEELLQTSSYLSPKTESFWQTQELFDYLQQRQKLNKEKINHWLSAATEKIHSEGVILPAVEIERHVQEFLQIARQITRFPLFRYLFQEELLEIAQRLTYHDRKKGYVFFQPQEASDRLFIIRQGEIEIVYPHHLQKPPFVLKSGDPVGELSFVTGANHSVSAIALTDVQVWTLRKRDFEEMIQQSKNLEEAIKVFLEKPKMQNYLLKQQNFTPSQAGQWIQKACQNMNAGHLIPSASAISNTVAQHKDAPMAIWLGLLMDGIPEALTIGAHLVSAPLSPSLLAGLFIANYPEALSSSQGMKEQGFSVRKILIMWSSITLITGILAAIGTLLFANLPESAVSFVGAMAAGAMLTVISETMLPEAYAKGGSIVGMSTLLGFLSIIVIKSWGH
ncbi:cyclic nucleotide-binding domain-containing protein [Crocosphaera sp. XPORK-15E]|uniref:cyclic nucleotide-binding domain-containing protein n=1 Tax=Crocosphaera sp. XPORK-15E TaxID=3110247 RepID=UPI002B201E2A|nr:cyclic nucleotide-binding domain-containing protein [Crocosphaera sp. XPORK-15E]MEA5536630.1 cyclic nucleotide-binding domain-containing protein [Crocosphaera sp. XPORK-15E]